MEKRGGLLVPTRSTSDQPEIVETTGALEIPLTGFSLRVRADTIRMLGYVFRGEGDGTYAENTLIAHFPRTGFLRSWAHGGRDISRIGNGLMN